NGEHRLGEGNAGPRQREGNERLDRARAAEWKGAPGQRIARGVADHERRKVRRIVERTQARPEAADVADPVERRAEESAAVFRSLCRELLEQVDRVERL